MDNSSLYLAAASLLIVSACGPAPDGSESGSYEPEPGPSSQPDQPAAADGPGGVDTLVDGDSGDTIVDGDDEEPALEEPAGGPDAEVPDSEVPDGEVPDGEVPDGEEGSEEPVAVLPDEGEPGPSSQPAGCGYTHERIGHTGTLVTRHHGVAGEVTVVDDCTLLVEHFDFDGNGIDVQLYGATDGAFGTAGISLLTGLKNYPVGYDDDTLEVTLPDDVTLDDFDSVSVWCVPAGVSFGDTVLRAP